MAAISNLLHTLARREFARAGELMQRTFHVSSRRASSRHVSSRDVSSRDVSSRDLSSREVSSRHTNLKPLAIGISSLLALGCAHKGATDAGNEHANGEGHTHDGSHHGGAESGGGQAHDQEGHHGGGHHAEGGHGEGHQHGMKHDFSDPAKYAAAFDGEDRESWQHTPELMTLLKLEPGARVVEIGAGTGYFMSALAKGVGDKGRVEMLDAEPAMVQYMKERATTQGLAQVYPTEVTPNDPKLSPGVDRILIVNVWHHLDARTEYAKRLRAALKPGGALLIVDFEASSPFGPPPKYRLTAAQVADELKPAGFRTEVLTETLPHQWVLRAEPS